MYCVRAIFRQLNQPIIRKSLNPKVVNFIPTFYRPTSQFSQAIEDDDSGTICRSERNC